MVSRPKGNKVTVSRPLEKGQHSNRQGWSKRRIGGGQPGK